MKHEISAVLILALPSLGAAAELRIDWIDPDTGHRLIRLSTEAGSSTLYFHDNSYSPQGDRLIFNSPAGIVLLDITRLGSEPPKPELVVPGGRGSYAAHKTRDIYFSRGGGPARGPDGKATGPATPPEV